MGIGDHVQSSFGHDGWDPPQDYGDFRNEGGGGGGGSRGPYRLKVPIPEKNPIEPGKMARKRVMIIGAPFYLWEHGTFKVPNVPRGIFHAICLKQNRIDDRCGLCEGKFWPSYGAYFTVIDLGFVIYDSHGGATLYPEPWTDKEGKQRESQFQRRLMVAKRGGKDNPGQLAYFEDQRARRGGDLTGCVFDTARSGEKKATIGDQWEFVERVGGIPPTVEDMQEYLRRLGAAEELLAKEYLFQRYTIRDMEEALLFSADELARWVGIAPASAGQQARPAAGAQPVGGVRTEGAGYGGEDVPDTTDYRGGPENW